MKQALGLALCVLASVPACAVRNAFWRGAVLSYEQYICVDQTNVPRPTPQTVVAKLGKPMAVREEKGAVKEIDYHAESIEGEMKIATYFFDEKHELYKKQMW